MKIKLVSDGAQMPKKSDERAIGYDLYASEDTLIRPNSRTIVPTGICIDLPPHTEGKIEARSGFSAKGMEGYPSSDGKPWFGTPKRYNADVITGKVDPGYVDPVGIIVRSIDANPFFIKKGTRLAQLTFYKVENEHGFEVVDEFDTESRGGGFGHGGTH